MARPDTKIRVKPTTRAKRPREPTTQEQEPPTAPLADTGAPIPVAVLPKGVEPDTAAMP